MNDRDWTCADDEVLASLRDEESGATESAKARVFQRLAAGLGASPGATGGDEAMAPGAAADAGAATGARAATGVGAANGARLDALVPTLGRPALALAFLLGGGVGAVGYATLARPPAPRIVYVDRVITAPEVAPTTDERAPAVAPAPSAAAPAGSIDALPKRDRDVSREVARGSAGAAKGAGLADLAAQQALLDEARASFGRGEHEAALRTITLHERRYPDSVLTEEREALAIKALVASRNYEKAKAMGARFAERYPRSLLLPAVRDALGSIP